MTAARTPAPTLTNQARRSGSSMRRAVSRATSQAMAQAVRPASRPANWATPNVEPKSAIGTATTKLAIGCHSSKAGRGSVSGGVE